MSARFPSWNQSEPYIQKFHGNPESALGIIWERGYQTELLTNELTSTTIEMQIHATREQVKDCLAEDHRRVSQYNDQDREYHRAVAESKRGGDYDSERVGAIHKLRLYFPPDLIAETLQKHGIRVVNDTSSWLLNTAIVLRLQPHHCFRMVNVKCERTKFRAAQFEWLRELSKNPPVESGLLFA